MPMPNYTLLLDFKQNVLCLSLNVRIVFRADIKWLCELLFITKSANKYNNIQMWLQANLLLTKLRINMHQTTLCYDMSLELFFQPFS